MQILIYGVGGTGYYLAAHLALAGHEVTLADGEYTPGPRLQMHSASNSQPQHVEFNVASSLETTLENRPYAWIGLTAPAYETTTIAYTLADNLKNPAPVVSFQNGIGNEVTLRSVLNPEWVCGGCLTGAIEQPAEGVLREASAGAISLAGTTTALAPISEALRDTGLRVESFPDVEQLKWSKLFADLIGNAVPAILDMPPVEVYRDYRLFDVEWASLREALWVLDHTGIKLIDLPGAPASRLSTLIRRLPRQVTRLVLLRYLRQHRGDIVPPLLRALRSGDNRTEAAWLNGAIVYHAQGIQRLAPINHALALTVSDIAAGRISWNAYRHNPDMLLKIIHLAQGQAS